MVIEASRLSSLRRGSKISQFIAIFVSAAAVVSLAGCSSSQESSPSEASSAGFPVTLKGALGSTTIETKPTRVSTIGWTNQDPVLALGIVPVDMPKMTFADVDNDGMYPWTKDALEKLGGTGDKAPAMHDETDDIDAEAIAATEPDVILGVQSGVSDKQYSTLNKIAPTVAYPSVAWAAPWREVVTESGKALGLSSTAKQVISSTEKTLADSLEKHPHIKGKTASVMYFDTAKLSSLTVYTTTDPREKYLNDLGLETPESVTKLSQGTDAFYKTVSTENADDFDDVDIIITYGDSTTLKTLQADPLLSKIPAIKRGSVVVIDQTSTLAASVSPSVLSIPATVDEYMNLIETAAGMVNDTAK